jgi:phosphatidylethanolamine-binding protein (PEBP) family uncharacterized protein
VSTAAVLLAASLTGGALTGCGGSQTHRTKATTASAATGPKAKPTVRQMSSSVSSQTTLASQIATSAGHSKSSTGAPPVTMEVSVPNLSKGQELAARNTCAGGVSVPVRWRGVPPHTAQVALFVVNLQPVDGKLFFDWAVGGLSASLHGVAEGRVPAGAVVGRNSLGQVGYAVCPPKGGKESYLVRVAALPHPLPVRQGFEAAAYYQEVEEHATAVGLAGMTYVRP